MNPIDLLMQDHRRVEQLFLDFQASESPSEQDDVFQTIQIELLTHTEVEEQAFYPALREEVPEMVDKALEDHAQLKELLASLPDVAFENENFDVQLSQLMETVQAHVSEEEEPGGLMEIALQRL